MESVVHSKDLTALLGRTPSPDGENEHDREFPLSDSEIFYGSFGPDGGEEREYDLPLSASESLYDL